ncbi:hypothetical protein evm_013689 [Chilo suppressalis]|nr:hypothetical protein evm_013689 [Chilo suppressalis]
MTALDQSIKILIGGDKAKLRHISKVWSEHYKCLQRVAERVTSSGRLSAVYKAVMEAAPVTLPCTLCIGPGERPLLQWLKSQSLSSPFEPMVPKYRIVAEDCGNLTIHNARREDSGVYQCKLGHSVGGIVVLDVVDPNAGYDVVKPYSSRGPHPASAVSLRVYNMSLSVFTDWSPWSECSDCGTRDFVFDLRGPAIDRRALGTCPKCPLGRTAFTDGVPCRSRILQSKFLILANVSQRRDEIMLGLCKVRCPIPRVFEVRSAKGAVLERANNTAGVFSLWQRLPTPAPKFISTLVFAVRGKPFNISCPGISLSNTPISWKVGSKALNPRAVDRESGGRVHLNARDQLVISRVEYCDANLYSCWQRHVLIGTVRLRTWEGTRLRWNHHATLVLCLMFAATALRVLDRITRDKRRRFGALRNSRNV